MRISPLETYLIEEPVELVAGTKILRGGDPHRSDGELPVCPQLGAPSPDPAIAGHDHEIEPGEDWHPIQLRSADRHFRQVVHTGIQHIGPATPSQELAEAKGVLVREEHRIRPRHGSGRAPGTSDQLDRTHTLHRHLGVPELSQETRFRPMLDKGKPRGHPHVPYLRNVNVQWGRIDTHDVLTMELADDQRERFAVMEGDLLVCEGGEFGRCAMWRGRTEYLAYQKALHRIRPGDNLDARFLRYLPEHHSLNGTLTSLATGSTIAHLPRQQLRRVPVPLPPLDEQHRIVDLLEDHLSRLDAADGYLAAVEKRAIGLHGHFLSAALSEIPSEEFALSNLLTGGPANGKSVPTVDWRTVQWQSGREISSRVRSSRLVAHSPFAGHAPAAAVERCTQT